MAARSTSHKLPDHMQKSSAGRPAQAVAEYTPHAAFFVCMRTPKPMPTDIGTSHLASSLTELSAFIFAGVHEQLAAQAEAPPALPLPQRIISEHTCGIVSAAPLPPPGVIGAAVVLEAVGVVGAAVVV